MTGTCALGDRLRTHVAAQADRIAYVFHRRYDDVGEALTWGDLWRGAADCAAGLAARGAGQGQGVLIFCGDERAFVTALVAVWMTGATAIPATGGLNAHLAERNRHILEAARPDIVLHDLPDARAGRLRDLAPLARFVTLAEAASHGGMAPEPGTFAARLLQFTSGSTARPKPVLLEPATLAAGCCAIEATLGIGRDSIAVHWLPLYHDMGLIGAVVQPLFSGATSVLLRPGIFIQRPQRWMELADRWRATITSAPNFAFERLCAAAEAGLPEGLELGRLRTVVFGGEPVLPQTVARLLGLFGPAGLRPEAIAPCYGMAEVTLLVSSGQSPAGPAFSDLNSHEPVANLGPVVRELTVMVCDPATGAPLPDGHAGDIWIDGPAAGRVIEEAEDWRSPGPRQPIRTGDVGYLLDGAIHVTGRTSNRIILRGRNVSAEDVEALLLASQPAGMTAGVAAIGLEADGTQTLCILVELANRNATLDLGALNGRLGSVLGVRPDRVVRLRCATLPRTSSGKIRRSVAREDYLGGRYTEREVADAQ